ncbi:hypothetical protein IWW50_006244 [Coemansia erecta]|nr:hypothetical protein GGF43_001355 [Coemansia sp. RSA 2618]KAJ2817215.1 hypothetical protein IWW50_006244 [Coemansia erecta]
MNSERPNVPMEPEIISRPMHRHGLYNDPRLEEKYRRRLDRLELRPPSKFSRRLQALNYAMMFGVGTYMVLFMDYGPRKHCFTELRGWFFRKIDGLWTLSKEEEKELRERGRIR